LLQQIVCTAQPYLILDFSVARLNLDNAARTHRWKVSTTSASVDERARDNCAADVMAPRNYRKQSLLTRSSLVAQPVETGPHARNDADPTTEPDATVLPDF
jgi:hypothetical protein